MLTCPLLSHQKQMSRLRLKPEKPLKNKTTEEYKLGGYDGLNGNDRDPFQLPKSSNKKTTDLCERPPKTDLVI